MGRILIVDDEEIARITLAEILRLEGHSIRAAGSGEEGVALLQKEKFDVMILDLRMPGMGGIDVLRTIVDQLPDLKVIVLTAHGSMDTAIQALRFKVHDYLLKPVSPAMILASISTAIEKLKAAAEVNGPGTNRAPIFGLSDGVSMDLGKRRIIWKDGGIGLTPTEARLLEVLFQQKSEMISHAELVHLCQGYRVDNEEAAKILRPVVSRLRQKMSVIPGWTDWIKNVRGSGYMLEINEIHG
jgi:DNA-binding response OmpR family regulator